jgi:hypothetical protein
LHHCRWSDEFQIPNLRKAVTLWAMLFDTTMKKVILIISFSFLTLCGKTQSIDGTFVGLEFNGLTIDSTGRVHFYGVDTFPNQRWFHEVKVIIKSNRITLHKYPVCFDSSGKKYSASDGGFITYSGTLTKSGDIYITKTKMVAYDYMGFSFFEPPQMVGDEDSSTIKAQREPSPKKSEKDLLEQYDRIKEKGKFIYFPKGTLRQDFIIRCDKAGIWLNNVFFKRVTTKQSP